MEGVPSRRRVGTNVAGEVGVAGGMEVFSAVRGLEGSRLRRPDLKACVREMSVEREGPMDALSAHQDERDAIGVADSLI